MSEILSIDQLRKMATITTDIPNFDNTGTIKVQVQKPRLMSMAAQGKIPNHLMSIATQQLTGKRSNAKKETDENMLKDGALMVELYCQACLVNPKYNEFKDIMTDDQMSSIFNWAMGQVDKLNSFRTDEGNGTSDNNVSEVQQKTE